MNGKEVISALSIQEYLKPLHAVSIKHSVHLSDEKGLSIDFVPIKGEAILNAIQLKKIY